MCASGVAATDLAALDGEWGWFGSVVAAASPSGPAPAIDDDLAYVNPWGFDPADASAPTLLVHGTTDRIVPVAHPRWLATRIPHAELRVLEGAGHLSVVSGAVGALEWIAARAAS